MSREYQSDEVFINETSTRQYQSTDQFTNETVVSAVTAQPGAGTVSLSGATPHLGFTIRMPDEP